MIPLPKYVRPVTKANGRRFYYFEKYRGTARAWPRLSLPADPLAPDFAQGLALLERIDCIDGKLQFVDVMGRRHDLPDPRAPEAFWAAVDKAEDIGRKLAAGEGKTFSALIIEYKDSDAYKKKLSDGSRSEYSRYLDMIEAAWGGDAVASLTPVDAQKAIDSYQETPAAARYFRSVLSRLIGWGIPRGYRLDNPIEHTERIDSDGTYEPWEPWQFELFFQFARPALRLAVFSGLFTGQRSVDVFKMHRPLVGASEMPIFAQKTGEYIPIQIHSEYRAIIEAAHPWSGAVPLRAEDAPMLHLREDGAAWTQAGFETAWQRQFSPRNGLYFGAEQRQAAAAMARLRAARTVFHGLRKNAVIMLLEAGCTEKQVEKIVGMSPAMVEHYAKRVNARRLAIAAMKTLESTWGEQRKQILGNVVRLA